MRILLLWALVLCGIQASAQNVMRVCQKDGSVQDIPVASIDSVTFVTVGDSEQTMPLVGTWKWVGQEEGYSETLTFRSDGSFICLDHYFAYGFDNQTYGTYVFFGSILNLRSNGYGYARYYQWMVTELTNEKLTVLTKMGTFTYTRVKDESTK